MKNRAGFRPIGQQIILISHGQGGQAGGKPGPRAAGITRELIDQTRRTNGIIGELNSAASALTTA